MSSPALTLRRRRWVATAWAGVLLCNTPANAGLSTVTIFSPSNNRNLSFQVYTPPGYATDLSREYPVVISLHGIGGTGGSASKHVRADARRPHDERRNPADDLALPRRPDQSFYGDAFDGHKQVYSHIIGEALPYVDAQLSHHRRPRSPRDGRIQHGRLRRGDVHGQAPASCSRRWSSTAVRSPRGRTSSQFNNAVAVEMYNAMEANFLPYSLWDLTTANAAALRSDVNYKMIVGDADSQYQSNVRFRDHLQSLGIDPQFQVLPGVEHVGGAYLSEGSGVRFLSEHFASGFRREGDYDRDGDVDTSDYGAWKTAFGSMTQLAADGNEDGVVDAADYVVWRKALNTSVMLTNETTRGMVTQADHGVLPANFGPTTGRGSAGSANATVPEPATALMLVVGILAMFSRRGAVMPSARQRMTPVDKPPSEHVF